MFYRSYWTWIALASLIVLAQLLGVTEKIWIKVGFLYIFFKTYVAADDVSSSSGVKPMAKTYLCRPLRHTRSPRSPPSNTKASLVVRSRNITSLTLSTVRIIFRSSTPSRPSMIRTSLAILTHSTSTTLPHTPHHLRQCFQATTSVPTFSPLFSPARKNTRYSTSASTQASGS